MNPNAVVLEWLNSVVADATPRPWVTEQLDQPRGYPQLEVTYANATIRTRGDGRLDTVWWNIDVGVVAWAHSARRFEWTEAWAAINPVIAALTALSAGADWTATTGERIENASNVVVTQGPDAAAKHATVTATFRLRVRAA